MVGSQAFVPPSNSSNSQQDMMYQMMSSLMEKMNGFEESLKKQENITSMMSQLVNTQAEQDAKKGGLPSNVVINPQNMHAMQLRSGRQYGHAYDYEEEEDEPPLSSEAEKETTHEEEHSSLQNDFVDDGKHGETELNLPLDEKLDEAESLPQNSDKAESSMEAKRKEIAKGKLKVGESSSQEQPTQQGDESPKGKPLDPKHLPFPNSYALAKKKHDDELEKEMLDLFSKLEVNVPMLVLVKQMPKYAKFLKDLCTNKRATNSSNKVQLGTHVSSLLKGHLPQKCGDPGSFTIPCQIGKLSFGKALLDLGAAINVMPKATYLALGLKNLSETSVVVQL